ncbi:MAG: hypothetical protein CSA35_09110 [Dethiosulfovibrio peptidovorans]|nr:MAG: hypothetical protein CSA35_09110 [Dethiosulfovibrio peptidovorans]
MKINRKNFFVLLNVVLGVVLALLPFVLFPVCTKMAPDGNPMKCYYTGIFTVIMGCLVVAIALLVFMAQKKGWLRSWSYILTAVIALVCYMVPHRIIPIGNKSVNGWECGLCANAHHSCFAVTMPALTKLIIVIVLVNIAALIYRFVAEER